MPPRRPKPTAASKARADRIAAALAGLLEDVPPPQYSGPDPYRGAELPPKPQRSANALDCPNCKGLMEVTYERGIEIHLCSSCGGLWLDPGELDEMVTPPLDPQPDAVEIRAQMRKVAPPVGEVRYRMCPRCGNPMNRRNYGSHSGVVIDECPRHGMYLDPGEFDAIETYIRMGGLELKRRKLMERTRARQRQAEVAAAEAAAVSNRQVYAHTYRYNLLGDLFGLF